MNIQQLIAYPQGTTEPITYPTGEVVLDLFKDEPIPLVLNVDDFTNVAEADASYSKSFEIPGTKKNNLFFNHIYDITSDSNFNPHKKTKIIVKEGSIDTFTGYLQLNEIVNKNGAITYDITLYSEAVNLKDILSERIFRDLDLSELNHNYSESNIINSWTGNLTLDNTLPANSFAGTGTTTDVLKYPFIRWNNGSYVNGQTIRVRVLTDVFRAFVNVKYIIKNIFRDIGYSFSSVFINSTEFSNLYIDFNQETTPSSGKFYATDVNVSGTYGSVWSKLDYSTINNDTSTLDGADYYDLVTEEFTANQDFQRVKIDLGWAAINNSSGASVSVSVRQATEDSITGLITYTTLVNGLNIPHNPSSYSTLSYSGAWDYLDNGDKIWVEFKSVGGSVSLYDYNTTGTYAAYTFTKFYVQNNKTILDNILAEFKGDINQWDFLKSFIDMFKLVIIQDIDNPNNLIIEPFKDWIDSGSTHDITNKINDSNIEFSVITGLSKYLLFKLKQDSKDWITENHDNPDLWKYSHNESNEIDIFDNNQDIIESKLLSSTFSTPHFGLDIISPQIFNNDSNSFNNELRMLSDNGVVNSSSDLWIKAATGWTAYNTYLKFSMLSEYPITFSTNSYNFGVVDYGLGGAVVNSLYNTYWLKYIDEIYHKDTRIVRLEAYITSKDISTMKFNDIILIKNKKFRLHKIEYRAGAMSKLELITIKDL